MGGGGGTLQTQLKLKVPRSAQIFISGGGGQPRTFQHKICLATFWKPLASQIVSHILRMWRLTRGYCFAVQLKKNYACTFRFGRIVFSCWWYFEFMDNLFSNEICLFCCLRNSWFKAKHIRLVLWFVRHWHWICEHEMYPFHLSIVIIYTTCNASGKII